MKAVWEGGAREIPQRRAEYLVWQVWSDLDPLSATPSWIWWARAELDLRGEPVPGETQARLSPGRGLLASANTRVTLWMRCLRFPLPCQVSPVATADSSQKHWQLPSHVSDLTQGQLLLGSSYHSPSQRLSSVVGTPLPKHQFLCVRVFLVVVV